MACVVSAQGHMEYVNRHLAERLGYVSEDLVGSSLTEFLAPETTDPVAGDGFRGWFDEGVTLARVFLVAKDGDRIPVMVSASIIPSPADRHSCLVSFQDVQQETPAEAATSPATAPDAEPAPQTPETQSADQPDSLARERRRREAVETELERNRAILGSIADDSPDGLFLVNSEGLVLYSNAAASRMFGRGDESLDGSQFNLPLVPGQAAEVGIVRPGTSPGVAELRVERTSWNSSPAYVARLHDVTKERKREDEAKRQEALLEGLRRLLQRVSSASGSEELARICRSMAKEISGEEPESS
jgi:PAS domain S-box-containing protein